MNPELPTDRITLRRSDAIVLFDWLMTVDLDSVPVTHPAQKQALVDLLGRLEVDADVSGSTQQQIDMAQVEVAKDMGW